MNYYNEFDPKAAAWLRELIKQGHIPKGDVDERSITEVKAYEISGYTQHHFFAGIGGWSLALRLARWPEDRPVCTASLPCQPFSHAGKQEGAGDDRHLWPVFFDLAKECGFERIFGEQVARAIGFKWLDGISADLEAEGYTVGSVVLGAHSVGAPHRRQRLYWVAHSQSVRSQQRYSQLHGDSGEAQPHGLSLGSLAQPNIEGLERHTWNGHNRHQSGREHTNAVGPVATGGSISPAWIPCECCDEFLCTIHGIHAWACGCPPIDEWGDVDPYTEGGPHIAPSGAWDDFELLPCRDGKSRRIESGTFPLAHGVPARVGRLRGYGNAIVPQVAAQFIQACEESLADERPHDVTDPVL